MTKARDLANAADVLDDVSATELSYVNGVTSAIQTQLNAKQATVANVNDTEIGYLDGVTSAIQTQLDAKVAKSLVDAKGDLLVGSANDTVSRLAVASTAGYVLTVDSAEATGVKWAAASSGGLTLLSTTTLSAASTTINIASGYKTLQIIGDKIYGSANNGSGGCYARFNSDSGNNYCFNFIRYIGGAGGATDGVGSNFGLTERLASTDSLEYWTTFQVNAYAVDGTDTVPFFVQSRAHSGSTATFFSSAGTYNNSAAISSITINSPGGETLYGTVYIYGAK